MRRGATRLPFLAFVASGDLTHSAMDFTVLDARVYGDVAVVLAHGTNQGKWRGEPFISDEWVTDVFVRRPGGWRCALSALTPNYAAAHEDDVDSLYRRVREAGANITADLEDHSYGGRSFSADDPEGHAWTFGQTIREVAPEDWGAVAT